jgi:hypothetical protein
MQFVFVFYSKFLQKGVPPLNRSQIKAKVKSIVETFTMENTCELPPPPSEVKIIGFYILLLKTDIVMDRKLLEKPKNIMVLLMKLETNGTLNNLLVLAFGQWYLYPPMNILQLLYPFCLSFFLFWLFLSCCCPSHKLVEGLKGQLEFQMLSNSL